MVLFSFSIPDHIEKIKSGLKCQTTRMPRKPHKNDSPAYKVGDKVQLYYKSRMKKSCVNCLPYYTSCIFSIHDKETCCSYWNNFFGESQIRQITHYNLTEYGHWIGSLSFTEKEQWAKSDGFGSWKEANQWFSHNTQNGLWAYQPLDVIIWDAEPIIKRWNK